MKALTISFTLVLVCLGVFAQTPGIPKQNKDDFERLSFEVEVEKSNYLLSEPITIKFTFSNKTADSLISYQPVFTQESELKVIFDGNITTFSSLSSITGKPMRFPLTIKPNVSIKDHEMFGPSFSGNFFPVPGKYIIQFILRRSDAVKSIASNIIDIVVEEPAGINREAFEFLKRHEKYFDLSSWVFQEKEGFALLETFVRQYDRSVYGEFGISSLAYSYLSQGEMEKAKTEFEKISFSQNKLFADDAKRSLADIERKLKEKLP